MTETTAAGYYEAPVCNSFQITTEGILCQSGFHTISDWVENEDVL